LKKLTCLAAVTAAALAAAGGAFAQSPTKSLVPTLGPSPAVWLDLLHNALPAAQPHRPAQHRVSGHRVARRVGGRTLSLYERTTAPWILSRQGCSAARRHERGVAVLDFGKPSYHHGSYGTILFSGRFAGNRKITRALLSYAKGYSSCLRKGSPAFLTLARGTSNYHPTVPSEYVAGVRWGRETNVLARLLRRHGLARHVGSAGADDAEPAWDRHFRKTRLFIHGFRMAAHNRALYDYGSLDGGVGSIWNAHQAFFVAGARATQALPEIYYPAMAREWAELARIVRSRYHRDVHFAGVMTQGTTHCRCGLRPHAAHRVLARALASAGVRHVALPSGGTNIVG
jgi:hypothetical protein